MLLVQSVSKSAALYSDPTYLFVEQKKYRIELELELQGLGNFFTARDRRLDN